MIYSVITPMGGGKTLFSSLYALEWSKIHENGKIYSNYRLNLPNATFTKFGLLPFSELEQNNHTLIILDDFLALKQQVSGILQCIANMSRKLNIDLILTAQYYTFVPKSIRELGQLTEVWYSKTSDILYVAFRKNSENEEWETYKIRNAVKIVKKLDLYDTNEIVAFASEAEIAREIATICKLDSDIKRNVEMITTSDKRRKKLIELIIQFREQKDIK